MIVCICANIDDEEIKEALKDGKCPVEDLGACQNCCICRETLVELQLNNETGV